ncbi:hypothetical protein RRG08_011943 [Elysia crispata]|uniref:Uncharacterized protein n=1 Tax=Elysia crispata TaxID=231223 RepID=A0AAE0ZJG2_9GAST|nr:hypothetical protein RRG08_011943 [Elysia crispata]
MRTLLRVQSLDTNISHVMQPWRLKLCNVDVFAMERLRVVRVFCYKKRSCLVLGYEISSETSVTRSRVKLLLRDLVRDLYYETSSEASVT